MENKHKINQMKLTPEQRDRLDAYNQATAQIKSLRDIADMTEGIISLLDEQKDEGGKTSKEIGSLLMDMRDSLSVLKNKEMPEMPDHAKPVVEAVSRLEKALSSAIKGIDVKPVMDAPKVNVTAPPVDLTGVEKAVKDIPKAFKEAIKLIPKVDIPKTDNKDLLKAWEGISEQLVSIENATRMKPLPGSMTISNLSGLSTEVTLAKTVGFDVNSDITTDISTPGIVIETDGVKTLTTDYTTSTITENWS